MLAWGGTPPTGKRVRDVSVTKAIVDSTDKPVIGFIRMPHYTGKIESKLPHVGTTIFTVMERGGRGTFP